ncbi:armadillo-type protein [Sparassis latifolia]
MESHEDSRPAKRFKHQSYKETLKEVHLPSALKQSYLDHEIDENDTHFRESLRHWRELNLSPAFISFANAAEKLSASMPLLLHNWQDIVELWLKAVDAADDEALKALLDVFQRLAHDLRTTLSPKYPAILRCLLQLLPHSLSAPALTALLATYSAVFKYVLIPSVQPLLLEQAWEMFSNTLPRCSPEVQRATAEVWGATLRRLKTTSRDQCVGLIAASSEGDIADAYAWILVYACKSVSQTLHTATSTLFSPLLQYHIAVEAPKRSFTLIRRVMTALIHHCKSAEQFAPVADLLVDQFLQAVKSDDQESIRRMLELVTVACSVRQGSRMMSEHLSILLRQFESLPLSDLLHSALLKFAATSLTAGDMSLWMRHGRKVVERSWERPALGIELCGALSDLAWGGWKFIALQHVPRLTPQLLKSHPKQTLELLVALHHEKRLDDVDIVWKRRFQTWVTDTLQGWEQNEENILTLNDVLALSSLLPSIAPFLVGVIDTTICATDPRSEYDRSYANSAWVMGACLQCLSSREPSEWVAQVDVAAWTVKLVKKWYWSSFALSGLVSLLRASGSKSQLVPLETLYAYLQASLLSHSHSLRLGALRLLTSPLVKSPSGLAETLKKCLQAEEVSIDLQGVRERVLRLGKLPLVVNDGDDAAAGICTRWLIAQFKVNLRPLWSPAAVAMSTLSRRFDDVVWRLVFQELQAASSSSDSSTGPTWLKEDIQSDEDDIWEEERSWRDPSAHRARLVLNKWGRNDGANRTIVKAQLVDDRFDPASYESQLVLALGECAALAEKHNRDLVPFFLSIAGPEALSKMPRYKLTAWLSLLSKFVNPKALQSTERLRFLYTATLSHPDRSLQRLSLSCMLTYKSPHLLPHEDMLRMLLDDTRWRDDLAQLDISGIELGERHELVDVLIRLLFGLMLEKRGRGRGAHRRAAILSALAGCTDQELYLLVDLMLQPIKKNAVTLQAKQYIIQPVSEEVSEKQQIGFLTLLGDVLRYLGSRLESRWPVLLETVLELLSHAQARLSAQKADDADGEESADAEEEPEGEDGGEPTNRSTRIIRQLGLKRLMDFFHCPVSFDFTPYMKESFRAFISPRLPLLDSENTQAPSALLELLFTWTLRKEHARYLVDYDNLTLPKIYACLVAKNVKPPVVSKIFDIVDHLLALSAEDALISATVLRPHVSLLLTNMSRLIECNKDVGTVADILGRRQITVLSEIAPYLTNGEQANTLLGLFSPLLRKTAKVVPEKVKVDLANILCSLFPLIPELSDSNSVPYTKTYTLLSRLFQSLRSRQARLALVAAFDCLAQANPSIQSLADLMASLNSYSSKRIDEPDFNRRMEAFTQLNESLYASLSSKDWLPILYNMLNFMQDPMELAVRTNAGYSLKRFIDIVEHTSDPEYKATFVKVLYPGIKNGLRSKNEMVRAELLGVLSYAVSNCDCIESFRDMRVLLAGGDEEANFFNNIHHVQVHRRTRAIHRLADHSDEGHLRSSTLAEVLIPLVGNYVVVTDTVDHHLVNEAITATGRMARHLSWGAYFRLTQQYLKLARQKDSSERVYVRALVAILDNFHFPMDNIVDDLERMGALNGDDAEGSDEELAGEGPADLPKVADISRIEDAVNNRLLPSLLNYLEKRDETEDSLRIPISIGIVQVARHLPESTREPQISKLLTVLSQIFRSKSQETRDLSRDALCRIAVILGPSYLPIMLRELRAALLRGPHLHVLAYVVHSLLVHVTTGDHATLFNKLDDCVNDVAHVSAEVVFGESGKDLQSEEFKTKMREVRSSTAKGLDSFSIMAKYITPSKISNLLLPIRNIMKETETLKVMQQVDDLLRRITGGLNANQHLVPVELLVLCHTLISQSSRFLKDAPVSRNFQGKKQSDAIVQTKRHLDVESDHYANNSFRFVNFGLELFITAHRRSRFDFQDASVIARLEPMVATIGNTLYTNHMQIVISGMRAAAAIAKCPLKSIQKSLPVFIHQMIDIIKQAGSTESEAVQTAFKSLATVLRDQPTAQVKEKDLVYLLELLSPDLEEPSRQASVFTMLRAIVSRKFIVPEIYDLMDKVVEVMVTSQSPQVQELCRGVLLQFLLDYPQGKGRLRNQMTLLAKNLTYVYESGRKSVMELLSAMISKFEVNLVREYSDLLFVSLVMVIANDDSAKCREMAAELIKSLFSRLADRQRNVIMSHLHSWATQHAQPQLARVSLQICGILIDLVQKDIVPYVPTMIEDLNCSLRYSAEMLESVMMNSEDADIVDQDVDWQTSYHALLVYSKVLRVSPDLVPQADAVDWPVVVTHLIFPHAWTRTVACRLLGSLFAAKPVAAPRSDLPDDSPLSVTGMEDVAKKLCLQLRSSNLDAPLSLQIVKNLFYIGKCFCAIELPSRASETVEEPLDQDDDEDDGGQIDEHEKRHPLPWLFSRLSFQARHAYTARTNKASSSDNWSHQPASVLKWFAAMVSFMDASKTELFLMHILSPVYRITEDDTIRDSQMDELKALAVELQELVQSKVGTTNFSNMYNRIRQGVLNVRRERRTARVLQATTNPEAAAKRKFQRNTMKKESRKRKNQMFAEGKGRIKKRREE